MDVAALSPQVGYSDEDCLKRWKALRDRFVREAKKVRENMTPDGGSGYVPPWSLFQSMAFLMESIRHRRWAGFSAFFRENLADSEKQLPINGAKRTTACFIVSACVI